MWKMYNETKADLKIKIGGSDEIDAKELSEFLKGTYDTLSKITSITAKNSYFKLNFKASEKGSVILDFSAITPEIFKITGHVITAVATLKLFLEVIKLIRDLKGKNPKKIDTTTGDVTNYYGEVNNYNIETINLYLSSPNIEKEIKKSVKNLKDRENIKYSINESIKLELSKEEINVMSIEEKEIEEVEEEMEILLENTELRLYKVPFQGNSQWDVIFENETIKVSIWDKNFLKKLHAGEIFLSSQDILIVDMKEIKEKNKVKYYILKVHEVKRLEI
ncbi:hypothetical protein EII29_02550 [Leptotrichia sp. OH3620_COT-345]|uniref:hypothetical protein n=1 Tax=Leptotrichia sp. OH3620_COT-345 TaxID=2491048 RepID=UPI000F650E19|nr:hypothetical protein [Leptotrichia sp. OH3620_COT-345]RRD40378.1 hypothetical protein EII29_02550 [Leptotrichia sp. OH3620_COT-345]